LAGVGGWERLQRFADAAPYRTLQIAAQGLGLNQFALVDQINRIERDFGDKLLIRAKSGRPMRLTPFGLQVVAAVRSVADILEPGHIREVDTADHAEISSKSIASQL
jgi:DNA-binding transcriptional LysR family regulator